MAAASQCQPHPSMGTQWLAAEGGGATHCLAFAPPRTFLVMDLNGDGRDDLLARNAAGDFAVWRASGGFFSYHSTFPTPFTDAMGWNEGNRFY